MKRDQNGIQTNVTSCTDGDYKKNMYLHGRSAMFSYWAEKILSSESNLRMEC